LDAKSPIVKTLQSALVWMVFGAVLFWTPAVIVRGLAGADFSRGHVIFLTYLLPLTVLAGLLVVRLLPSIGQSKVIAPFALVGIWLFGGVAMTINATFSGGGFATPEGWKGVLLGAVPPFNLMMASYDGSLFALLLTSLCLVAVWLTGIVRPKLTLHSGVIVGLAVLVVAITAVSQVALGVIASRLGQTASTAQEEPDHDLDSLTLALKSAYHTGSDVPPHVPGLPAIVTIRDLAPVLAKTKIEIPQGYLNYRYCNLEPRHWAALRKSRSGEQRGFLSALTFDRASFEELRRFGEYPVAWSPKSGASDGIVVVTVSFSSDIFRPCIVSTEDLDRLFDHMQSTIRRETGDESFSLDRSTE
jgi:hypothetical protein